MDVIRGVFVGLVLAVGAFAALRPAVTFITDHPTGTESAEGRVLDLDFELGTGRSDCAAGTAGCHITVRVVSIIGPDGEEVSWCYKCPDGYCIPDEVLCAIPGDFDGDGDVDLDDFRIMQAAFTPPEQPEGEPKVSVGKGGRINPLHNYVGRTLRPMR